MTVTAQDRSPQGPAMRGAVSQPSSFGPPFPEPMGALSAVDMVAACFCLAYAGQE